MFGPGILRVVLASLVVLSHTSGVKLGGVAVIAFFILSGYWVTRQFDQKYRHDPAPLRTFYLSRFLRLYPAYVAALLLAFAARKGLGIHYDPDWPQALPLLGVATHAHDLLGVSWSLDLEMQFYLIAPLAFPLLKRGGLVLVLLAALTWVGFQLYTLTGIKTVFIYIASFGFGALIHAWNLTFTGRQAAVGILAAVLILIGFKIGFPGAPEFAADTRFGVEGAGPNLLVGLMFVPLVGWAVRLRSGGFDRYAGDYSYSLYLVHYPFFLVVRKIAGGEIGDFGKLAMIAGTFAFAALFFHLVDRPVEHWRATRFRKTRQRAEVGQQ
ncbi:MAG: acyltransferase [Albidovulum sp.]|uniref:acyltransferase family protein n=1 Tax=Albidovulum sp. TaxID=1872424 RepID=UPI003CA06325